MKPLDHYSNGDEGSGSTSDSGSEREAEAEAEEMSLVDAAAPARALAALNALRKSRQHYDVVLVAEGAEVPAHRAVLAAASPHLLEALPAAAAGAELQHRLEGVQGGALRALVEYAYTGVLAARGADAARRLYLAAWRLRVEPARAHLAERLLRAPRPDSCLAVRALPGLTPSQLAQLDRYIAANFECVCSSGALAALPQLRLEVLRDSSAAGGAEGPLTVAEAALAWVKDRFTTDQDFEELCSRSHLVYVDGRGALRDCNELPPLQGDAPELQQYRREARERGAARGAGAAGAARGAGAAGAGPAAGECAVLAARGGAGGTTRALLAVRGRLAAARATWSAVACGGGGVARGGALAGGGAAALARLEGGRCAGGAAALAGRLLVCGGYDRARVLRDALLYDPDANEWRAAPAMRRERARFPAVRLHDTVYVIGGSDGHAELDGVDAFDGARWRGVRRLPLALSHAAAAGDEAGGALVVAGGWAAGGYLRRTFRYSPAEDAWTEAPPLNTARAQAAGVWWEGAAWALGGCDAWHCLASTERLAGDAGWTFGPPLPTPRRSMGGCVWRGRLVSVGGSDGAASLRRTDWLGAGWTPAAPAPDGEQDGASPWQSGPALRRARAGPGVAALGGALYAVGGFDGKEFLSCAECLLQAAGEWTALAAPASPLAPLAPAPAPRADSEQRDSPAPAEEAH